MSKEISFDTFPKNNMEALALMYCDKHSNENTTPEELVEMYYEAYKSMRNKVIEIRSNSKKTISY